MRDELWNGSVIVSHISDMVTYSYAQLLALRPPFISLTGQHRRMHRGRRSGRRKRIRFASPSTLAESDEPFDPTVISSNRPDLRHTSLNDVKPAAGTGVPNDVIQHDATTDSTFIISSVHAYLGHPEFIRPCASPDSSPAFIPAVRAETRLDVIYVASNQHSPSVVPRHRTGSCLRPKSIDKRNFMTSRLQLHTHPTVNLVLPLPVYVITTHRSWRTFKKEDFISQLRSSHCVHQTIQTRTSINWPSRQRYHHGSLGRDGAFANCLSSGAIKATVVRRRLLQVKKRSSSAEKKIQGWQKTDSRARWRGALKSSRKLAHSKAAAYWKSQRSWWKR